MKRSAASVAVIGFASVVCTVLLLTFSHMTLSNPYFNVAAMHYPFIMAY